MRFGLLLAALLAAGCASHPVPPVSWPSSTVTELEDTPFFPQTRYQCGPAALATVLVADGVAVTPEALSPQVFLPGRRGSLQLELVAATRRQQRLPYVLAPELDALFDEVAAGRPVLLLQNLGLSWIPVWHYAVVIGFDADREQVVLRSGTDRRRVMSAKRFTDTWRRGGRWAMVTVRADEIPRTARPLDWLAAANAFEQLGQGALALSAYDSASRRWPESALVWQVLGNARYAAGDRHGARAAYRAAVQRAPDAAGYNNLAQTELELGCVDAARAALATARTLPATAAVSTALAETGAAVERAPPAAHCAP